MEEENQRILEFSHQQQEREEGRMAERKKQEEAKAAVQQELAEKIAIEHATMDEMERYGASHEIHLHVLYMLDYVQV